MSEQNLLKVLKIFGVSLVGLYVDTTTKVLVECENGHQKEVMPRSTCNSRGSFSCGECKLENFDKILQEKIRSKGGSTKDKYKSAKTKLTVDCGKGHTFNPTYDGLVNSDTWCEACYHTVHDDAKEKYEKIIADKEATSETYVNASVLLWIECKLGHRWQAAPYQIVNMQSWCRQCFGSTKEAGEKRFKTLITEKKWQMVGEYVRSDLPIAVVCDKKHSTQITLDSIARGRGCPVCRTNRGEKIIRDFLDLRDIKYYSPYFVRIGESKHFFDFYLPDYNLYIEFDGEQHFFGSRLFNRSLEEQRSSDLIKNKYVEDSNKSLLRIPFWFRDDIPDILTDIFNNLSSYIGNILPPDDYFDVNIEGIENMGSSKQTKKIKEESQNVFHIKIY